MAALHGANRKEAIEETRSVTIESHYIVAIDR
jgi:hypothetical protein